MSENYKETKREIYEKTNAFDYRTLIFYIPHVKEIKQNFKCPPDAEQIYLPLNILHSAHADVNWQMSVSQLTCIFKRIIAYMIEINKSEK